MACVAILSTIFVWGGAFGGIYWRHVRAPIAYEMLPWVAIALLSVSLIGELLEKTAHRRFRIAASVVGIIAMVTGMVAPILEPAY
jgi:hypothetical protein